MATREKVVILGGGIAGMSAAHELVERGFAVEVFERKPIAGGKARSLAVDRSDAAPPPFRKDVATPWSSTWRGTRLPGEHGFRFFPGFYKHVVDTMSRIPYGAGSAADNLVDTTQLRVAAFDRPAFDVPAEFPRTGADLQTDLFALIAVISGRAGVPIDDGMFFATKVWEFLTSCEERRLTEYERVNWWDFVEAGPRSAAYQKFFGNGITRSLVAAKARRASTRTIGDIFVQLVSEILLPDVAADRVLNGPTSDIWINPWLAHLRARGVVYHTNADVRGIQCDGRTVRSATVAVNGAPRTVTGNYFIGALPVERMSELIDPALLAADPSLANLHALTEYVEWMNGIQFYLTEDVPITHGHTICVDSPWALTLVSQAQFWQGFDLTKSADGGVKGILSVDISDWDVKGFNGKEAQRCSRDEIAVEAWEQLKASLNVGQTVLKDELLHSWFLDPDIQRDGIVDPVDGSQLNSNLEPLLVNYVDTWRLRPEAVTRIPNFFLASDYVRTFTDLATMEAANEAARRAVNGILHHTRADVDRCTIWNLHEPELLAPWRAYDRVRYRQGLSWDGQATSLIRTPLASSGRSAPGASDPAPDGSPAHVAADARASSDDGLRRLRIQPGT